MEQEAGFEFMRSSDGFRVRTIKYESLEIKFCVAATTTLMRFCKISRLMQSAQMLSSLTPGPR